jgi:large subunit ribosomal protein L17
MAGKKFGRNQTLRAATLRDLAKAVLSHQSIRTTRIKAHEARKLVDKLITMGKKGTLAAKRRAFAILCDHKLVSDLFSLIAPRFASRQGGYTRIIKFAINRQGDNAEMVILELTEKDSSAANLNKEVVEEAQVVEPSGKEGRKTKGKGDPSPAVKKQDKETKGKSKKTTKKD